MEGKNDREGQLTARIVVKTPQAVLTDLGKRRSVQTTGKQSCQRIMGIETLVGPSNCSCLT